MVFCVVMVRNRDGHSMMDEILMNSPFCGKSLVIGKFLCYLVGNVI